MIDVAVMACALTLLALWIVKAPSPVVEPAFPPNVKFPLPSLSVKFPGPSIVFVKVIFCELDDVSNVVATDRLIGVAKEIAPPAVICPANEEEPVPF